MNLNDFHCNYTKNFPKLIWNQLTSPLIYNIADMIRMHSQAPNNMKNFLNYSAYSDWLWLYENFIEFLELNESPSHVITAGSTIEHELQYKMMHMHTYINKHSYFLKNLERYVFSNISNIL